MTFFTVRPRTADIKLCRARLESSVSCVKIPLNVESYSGLKSAVGFGLEVYSCAGYFGSNSLSSSFSSMMKLPPYNF
jgi:hypothetical protein